VTTAAAPGIARDVLSARPGRRRTWSWIGLVPFFAFAILFMILPVWFLIAGSFQNKTGAVTLDNYTNLQQELIFNAYANSIEISLVTAIAGGIFGFLLAYAIVQGGLPGFVTAGVLTWSGVASNFAGVPLALAFTFTLGFQGLVTRFLLDTFGIQIYTRGGFNLYTKLGLEIVYLYFQLPLMVLIIAPAIRALRPEWREAAENLGASTRQYWRRVALPILLPTILGTIVLLFGNAFGAQATAYQLTVGQVNIVTNLISAQISGDVLHDPGLGYAMAMGMVVIMAISITGYSLLQRRSERWLR